MAGKFQLVEAGGYTNLTKQLSQLDNCVAQGAQAVIIGGISYDGLNAKLQEFIDNDVIVVDLINGMSNPNIQAHSLITARRLRKPISQKMCRKSQKIQAKTPDIFQPYTSPTAAPRPIVARMP